jgi:hypothetical protein
MMPVVEAASREGHGVGAVLGSAEHAALLAVPGDPVALEVGDVGRQRRRAEGPPLMADHRGLDDDTTVGGEQTAAGERGAASPERRAAATGAPLLAVIESGPTPACFLARRTSSTKLLTAASIADASD